MTNAAFYHKGVTMRWKRIVGIIAGAGIIIVLAAIAVLATFDVNRLKPFIADIVRTQTGSEIHLNGDIQIDIGLAPKLIVDAVTFQNASWGSRPDLARIKQLELQIELLPLILGKVRIKRLSLVEPDVLIEVNRSGESNFAFDLPITTIRPAVKEVYLQKAKLKINDRRTRKTTTLKVKEFTLKAADYDQPSDVKAQTSFNGTACRISGRTGAISDLFEKQKPWPIKLAINALGADITVVGKIDDPLGLKGADLRWTVAGRDVSTLQAIAGRPLPKSPFSLSGHLLFQTLEKIEVTGLRLKMAENTVKGAVTLDRMQGVPMIVAQLQSDDLDLRPFFEGNKNASAQKKKSDQSADKKIFPDKPFAIGFLARFDTSVDVRIARLILPGIAAEAIAAKIGIKSGRFNMNLSASNVGGGRFDADLDLVPQGKLIAAVASASAKDVDLGQMLKDLNISSAIEGLLDLTVKLKGSGNSVAALMAGLDGDIIAILGNGRMPLEYINLVGEDISASLIKLLNPFAESIDTAVINCLVADFNIADGQAKSDIIVIDDPRKTLIAHGRVDLKTEVLDFWVEPKPKEGIGFKETGKISISLKELTRPFKLGGTLAHPEVELDTVQTAKTIGTALLGPLGIAWLMVSGSSGTEDVCANALKIAGEGAYEMDPGGMKNKKSPARHGEGVAR